MSRFLSLWLPRWPVQRWAAARTELPAGAAIVLYREQPGKGLRVAACCPVASRQGVQVGMSLTEAAGLVRHGRDGRMMLDSYDPAADREALQQLARGCESFSPRIGLEESDPPAGLVMDVSGVAPHFGGEEGLAGALVEHLRRQRYVSRVAIAETLGMAWGAAHFGPRPIEHIAPGDRGRLEPLPVAALRLAPAAVQTLHRLGIDTVGQLAALPRRELRSRFGDELLWRLGQWHGEVPELIAPIEPVEEIAAEIDLEYAVSDRQAVGHLIGELLDKIAPQLEARRLGATQLECRLHSEAGPAHSLRIGFCTPSNDPRRMHGLLLLQLESLLLSTGVDAIALRVTEHAPRESWQGELLGRRSAGESRELLGLLDLLSTRLGPRQVTRPRLQQDHQPERAYLARPVGEAEPPAGAASGRSAVLVDAGCLGYAARPLILLDPPVPLREMALDDRGLPRAFVYRQQRWQVDGCSSRETIETGWWRGPTVRRDYHRVRTLGGSTFWLYRDLSAGGWFVQGEFL